MANIETAQRIYGAFGAGDIPAILEQLDENVAWDHAEHGSTAQAAGVPYLQSRTGHEAVVEFFEVIGETFDFERFEVVDLLASESRVVALISIRAVNRATGAVVDDLEAHVWTFGDGGRVVSLDHLLDTQKHIEAASA